MNRQSSFKERVDACLDHIGRDVLAYNKDEFWMIERDYVYLKYYAYQHELLNMAIALPLARAIHNGVHRKAKLQKDGVDYRLPYVIHCLKVCRMLVDMELPLSPEDEDILMASALCHDMIEDNPFEDGGHELHTRYCLDKRVYDTVLLVSKRKDFTEEDHLRYFDQIMRHPLALLVKLSDRGNNVEDLYNMKFHKVHEYVDETRTYFLPMCRFAKEHYPELVYAVDVFRDKMETLTLISEMLVDKYAQREKEYLERLEDLRKENEMLRARMKTTQWL